MGRFVKIWLTKFTRSVIIETVVLCTDIIEIILICALPTKKSAF